MMAIDIFAFFEGSKPTLAPTITVGEKDADARSRGVPVQSVEFGISNSSTIGTASTGAGAGKAQFKTIILHHQVDAASPMLMSACAKGSHYDTMTLEFFKRGSTASQTAFFRVICKMVFITDIETHVSAGDDIVMERILIAVGAMQINYFEQKPDGALSATPISATWNQVKNNESLT